MAKKFIFRSNQTIGAADAEMDGYYLSRCFVDTGDLTILRDCEDPRRILIGRTGSGKSALIARLVEEEEHVIQIHPDSLSLTYISNSNVLKFFSEAGVKLDIFYRLLWRHVICVEILKERFHIDSEESKKSFLESLWRLIPQNKKHEQALAYLREWGESFWRETEYRIQEITTKLEQDLQGAVESAVPKIGSLRASAARKLTEEEKEEVVHRAQEIVNRAQIRQLSDVIDLLDEVLLTDPQQRYYLTVDPLDKDWIEDNFRFRLIRALIETSLDFARIKSVKIIAVIRRDLLDRVYRYTRDPGFQEEKYRTSSLDITWTRDQLIEVLDTRIDLLVKEKYTKKHVTHKDLLPSQVGKRQAIDYILDRTLMRPRDIIHFFNICIQHADGKPTVTLNMLREAEGTYSRERLRALADEWFGIYPNLLHLARVLRNRPVSFQVKDLSLDELEENYLYLLVSGTGTKGIDLDYMNMAFEGGLDLEDYRKNVILIFYRVGLVGLKTERYFPLSWSHVGGVSVSKSEVDDDTRIYVHDAFKRALGIPGKRREY